MVESEVTPREVFLASADVKRPAMLLGVKKCPIDKDLPAIAFGHRVKYLPAFKCSSQIELHNAQLHKILTIHFLTDLTQVDEARADQCLDGTPGKKADSYASPRPSLAAYDANNAGSPYSVEADADPM